jgi:formyl-CoA transferase
VDGRNPKAGALEGIRVLELADWIAGPYAGSLLADFGARVVIVERPEGLSGTRQLGGMREGDRSRSPYFYVFARNKQSLVLDFTTQPGRELLLRLVEHVDVVITSFRPGTLERRGIGWDELSSRNPGLVLLEISGFGRYGPLSGKAGFDRVAQAFGGLTYVTGHPEMPPTRAGLGVVDYVSGLYGAFGVMVALEERRRSGQGQRIDHALYESLLPMHLDIPVRYVLDGTIHERSGNYFPGYTPGDTFQTADGVWIHISATGDPAFRTLMTAIDRDDLIHAPEYATMRSRDEHRDELHAIVGAWVAARTIDDAETLLMEAGAAASRIQNIGDIMGHPHVQSREDFSPFAHPKFGDLPAVAPSPKLSRTPGTIRSAGPDLGADTAAVLSELLGVSGDEAARLLSSESQAEANARNKL